ncbi:MAG: tetraacyldisaccharide 4-kinase [Pseudomonadota bacterium]|nr:tetraacyldisaccharide 4-kinase [Pseudomonadota bacterium]
MQIQKSIETHWYYKNNPFLNLWLSPFSLLFFLISIIRKTLYRVRIFKSFKLPVPVVIIGNISVGGAGKTPLTKYLAQELTNLGFSVGVILRGYKSQIKGTHIVLSSDDSKLVGDEALVYAKNNIRVAIGIDRYLAGVTLLKKHPDIQIILADDGLQHYKLQRDYEIAVIDSTRMLGNRFVLPMGPLREMCCRLKSVNAVVINGKIPPLNDGVGIHTPGLIVEQKLVLEKIFNLKTEGQITAITQLSNKKIAAIAAIGNPQRFFDFLTNLGIKLTQTISFPDHHSYTVADIRSLSKNHDIILVTEKDSAKLYGAEFKDITNVFVVLVKPLLDNHKLIEQLCNLVKSK